MAHSKLVETNRPWVRDAVLLALVAAMIGSALAYAVGLIPAERWPATIPLVIPGCIAVLRSGLWLGQPMSGKYNVDAVKGRVRVEHSSGSDVLGRIEPATATKASSST